MAYNKETGLYEGFIYIIINKINGRMYIGQTTTTIERRFKQHSQNPQNKSNSIIDFAIRKYGEDNFKVECLCQIFSDVLEDLISELNRQEIYYIKEYNTKIENGGYNITDGGNQVSSTCCTPVDVYDQNLNLIGAYISIAQAMNCLNIDNKGLWNIISCLNGKRRIAYGYIWRYQGHNVKEFPVYSQHLKEIPIDVYDSDGNLIAQYDDIYEIPNTNDIHIRSKIYTVCNGKKSRYNGMIYRYKGDAFDKYKLPIKNIRNASINCYSIDDIFIKFYDNSTEAANDITVVESSINSVRTKILSCAKGNYNSAYGYKWFYANDSSQPDKTKIIT